MTLEEKGFVRTLRLQGHRFQVLTGPSAGETFLATNNRIGAYNLNASLGDDPRGKRVIEIRFPGCPQLNSQNQVKDLQTLEKFAVTTIGLDSPAYSKRFEVQQLTAGDT